jgi:outer membrane protein TolC
MDWEIFDWGKKRSTLDQRQLKLTQAEQNLTRVSRQVELAVGKAYRNVSQCKTMLELAEAALDLRTEQLRLADDQLTVEAITAAAHWEARTARDEAAVEEFQAYVAYRLSLSELDQAMGTLP